MKDVSTKTWNELADEYVQNRAVLIARSLYTGTSEEKQRFLGHSDDWMLDGKNILVFQVTGVKQNTTRKKKGVNSLTGNWVAYPEIEKLVRFPDLYTTLHWNDKTFSWGVISSELTAMHEIFSDHKFDLTKPYVAYLDVPFGHVIDGKSLEGNNLFYRTNWAKLGPVGTHLSNKGVSKDDLKKTLSPVEILAQTHLNKTLQQPPFCYSVVELKPGCTFNHGLEKRKEIYMKAFKLFEKTNKEGVGTVHICSSRLFGVFMDALKQRGVENEKSILKVPNGCCTNLTCPLTLFYKCIAKSM